VFSHKPRGLMDFAAALLCLWAAAYHTPIGALARGLASRLTGVHSTARPLLAYYSGGVYDAQELKVPTTKIGVPDIELLATVPPGEAMARAVFATLNKADTSTRTRADGLAKRHGLDNLNAPKDVASLLDACKGEYGSVDGAVLAVFAGHEVTRFAVQRAKAEGSDPTLEALARQLPPDTAALDQASTALALGTALALSWPVPPDTRITSPFGWRMHPILGRSQFHTGVDLSVPLGTPVHAAADGFVRRASEDAVNGKVVIIDHGHGVSTAYCHNSQLLVAVGQRITQDQVISFSGSTGRSTGPHVHFQVELGGTPVDPLAFKGKGEGAPVLAQKPKPTPTPTNTTSKKLKDAFDRAVVEPQHDDDARDGEGAAPTAQP